MTLLGLTARWVRTSAVAAVLLAAAARPGLAQSLLYDDFKGNSLLDPDKWTGLNFQNSDGATLELGREVRGGRLRFLQRVVGGTTNNVGEHFAVNALTSSTGASAIALEARFNEVDLTHCSEPGAVDGFVLLRLFNNLFSDTDGNVFAFIDISQVSGSGEDTQLNVTAELSHEAFGSLAVLDLGTVKVGKRFSVRMEWVAGSDRVDFQKGSEPVGSIFYPYDDSGPPAATFDVSTETAAANCTAGRRSAQVRVSVHEVRIDPL